MVQAGSGVAGLSSLGSGFHQSFLMLAFGRRCFLSSSKGSLLVSSVRVDGRGGGGGICEDPEAPRAPGAPGSPGEGGGGGGGGGGDPEGVLGDSNLF
ncbi:hypothetical protein Tco_1383733, partial [Tanacetum coccineum]